MQVVWYPRVRLKIPMFRIMMTTFNDLKIFFAKSMFTSHEIPKVGLSKGRDHFCPEERQFRFVLYVNLVYDFFQLINHQVN